MIIDTSSWDQPEIFNWIQDQGNISTEEMQRTFNCGIGMVLIIKENYQMEVTNSLEQLGYESYQIGYVEKGSSKVVLK